jgi:LacI family transcriptional regulator
MVHAKPEGQRRATIRDVADLAGTSVSTVSNALTGQRPVGPETRARINAAVSELGYRANSAAHTLRTGIHKTIGLVVPDIKNPFFAEVSRGVEDAAQAQGWSVFLGNTDLNAEREEVYLRRLGAASDGILFFPTSTRTATLAELVAEGKRVVVCDERLEVPGVGLVLSDNRAGGRLAGEHLLAAGGRQFAVLGGPQELPTAQERLAGFEEGLAAGGRKLRPARVLHARDYTVEEGRRLAAELVDRDKDRRVDAIFAANDFLAIGALRELAARGRPVPDDVLLCGFDGIGLGDMVQPSLTSVAQQSYQLGVEAGRLLLSMIVNAAPPREIMLSVGLESRASTRR